MKNKNGSAIMWSLITIMFCLIIVTQIGNKAIFYSKQTNNEIDSEQIYLTSIDTVNIFADEICQQTQLGNLILNYLSSGNSLTFENLTTRTDCNCNVKIEMPYKNKIKISSHANKNNFVSEVNLNILLDETVSPAVWTIKNYERPKNEKISQ